MDNTLPADLLACPQAPHAFPTDQFATIPATVRDAMHDLALAYRDAADRLSRLIDWHAPGTCPTANTP